MSIPSTINREHLLKAIDKIDKDGIPSGADSQYYDVVFNDKRYPPKLIVSFANIFANGIELERTAFGGGINSNCFKLLEKEGFIIETKLKMQNIKLYDIHGASAIENFGNLLDTDNNYFYWDHARFKKYAKGDIVFWVNRTAGIALYTIVDSTEVNASFSDGKMFMENKNNIYAKANDAGQYESFYRFKVLERVDIPNGWDYKNKVPFGGQVMAIILYEPYVKEPEKKIPKIEDLKILFSANTELCEMLDNVIVALGGKVTSNQTSIMEKFRQYMYGIHKNKSTSDQYINAMPKIQKWFIDNNVISPEYDIWKDIQQISAINEKLSGIFKEKWRELNKNEGGWYGSPWNLWVKFNENPMISKVTTPMVDTGKYTTILNAIKTKPFILLAGISGTGKSRLVRTLAFQTCSKEDLRTDPKKPGNFELIPVRPNWHDSTELMGYISRINGEKYITTSFLKFIAKAWRNPDTPFFLCLDEMNLAPVEQYFAEYLSIIETRQVKEDTVVTDYLISRSGFENKDLYQELLRDLSLDDQPQFAGGIGIPANLVVIGTVNMDETTHSFSRKVLDRAMTFELNDVDLLTGLDNSSNDWDYPSSFIELNSVTGNYTAGNEVVNLYPESKRVIEFLQNINKQLEGTPFKIAYRVRDEFLIYCYYASLNKAKSNWLNKALDEMTSMKILSRIEGDESKTLDAIQKLEKILNTDQSGSTYKLKEMESRLQKSGYTSYWS